MKVKVYVCSDQSEDRILSDFGKHALWLVHLKSCHRQLIRYRTISEIMKREWGEECSLRCTGRRVVSWKGGRVGYKPGNYCVLLAPLVLTYSWRMVRLVVGGKDTDNLPDRVIPRGFSDNHANIQLKLDIWFSLLQLETQN